MTTPPPCAQAIQDRYWRIANDPNERGYTQVRALDSLCRLLDLFPRGQRSDAPTPPPEPESIDPNLAIAAMSDDELDALMAREEADRLAKQEATQDEDDDDASHEDEDEPP
ncbi:MAG: hypothetical protein OXI41_04510 [Chloroflexota bacterium]|nr:hypothetical protein [Chloroflexota bacterium]MDE2895430.1 hypothetical protein [Chloroflexota bacterium]